ncbi:hypothetical protein ACVWW2_008507 [Bradyrhizobium sp. LM4.3]
MKTATGPDKGHSDALTGKLTLGAIARLDPETLLGAKTKPQRFSG